MRTARQYGLPGPTAAQCSGIAVVWSYTMCLNHSKSPFASAMPRRGVSRIGVWHIAQPTVVSASTCPCGALAGNGKRGAAGSGTPGRLLMYAYRSAICLSLNWGNDGMMPQGFCTAWRNCACVSFRPARSGPNPPSPLFAWQFLHDVVFPSQRALPATGSPAGADVCAAAIAANIGISRSASNSLFMRHYLCFLFNGRPEGRPLRLNQSISTFEVDLYL